MSLKQFKNIKTTIFINKLEYSCSFDFMYKPYCRSYFNEIFGFSGDNDEILEFTSIRISPDHKIPVDLMNPEYMWLTNDELWDWLEEEARAHIKNKNKDIND